MECSRIDGLEEGDRARREPLVGETWPSESLTELLVVTTTGTSSVRVPQTVGKDVVTKKKQVHRG